jgi:hypothetical protein
LGRITLLRGLILLLRRRRRRILGRGVIIIGDWFGGIFF